MEELKSFDKESVPDLGQDYWMHMGRMERCKGWSLWHTLLIAVPCAIISAYVLIWSGGQPPGDNEAVDVAVGVISTAVFFITGVAAFALICNFIINTNQQRRWRDEMPLCPENYTPELAETAYHLEHNIRYLNTFQENRLSLNKSIESLTEEINDSFARIEDFQKVMSEEDVDTFTLHS